MGQEPPSTQPADPPREPPTGAGGSTDGSGPDDRPSRSRLDKRRAALIGAAYEAHGAKHADAPYFLRPLSLGQVVEHLKTEAVPIRLQGAAWLVDGEPSTARKARLLDAIHEILGPSLGGRLGGRVDNLFAEVANNGSAIGGHPRYELGASDAKKSRFAAALEYLTVGRAGCVRRDFNLHVHQNPDTLVTFAGARVDVDRPAADFTVMADPQNWRNEAPIFWIESDLVVKALGGKFVPIPNQPPPGTEPYTDQLLHELITMSYNPFFPIIGNNVLTASCRNTEPYGFDVSLYKCCETTIGASTEAGGIDVDSGRFTAASAGGSWTRLTATKEARFTAREMCGFNLGPWLNAFAPFVLGAFMGILVYEGACAS
jgi:hypothetical protein